MTVLEVTDDIAKRIQNAAHNSGKTANDLLDELLMLKEMSDEEERQWDELTTRPKSKKWMRQQAQKAIQEFEAGQTKEMGWDEIS